MSGVEERLAEVLAAHYFFALDPSRCHGCGEHLPCDGEPTDEHRAHVAAALAPVIAAERASALREAADDLIEFAAETYPEDVLPKPTPRQYDALNSHGHAHMRSAAECYRHAIKVQAGRLCERADREEKGDG